MGEYSLTQIKVLVAEDYAPMRKIIGQMLFELEVADFQMVSNGQEAVEFLEEYSADLLLLDNLMAPIGGTELTRMVRQGKTGIDQQTPIIMISGELERGLIVGARDAGVNEFLAKPVSTGMIYQRYRTIIDNPRAYIETGTFYGPDRRRRQMRYPGLDKRREAFDYTSPPAPTRRDGKSGTGTGVR